MKKGLIILGALALSACTIGHETDLDVAAEKRFMNIQTRHQTNGCTFVRDHEAYKNCLVNTYNLNQPATYQTSTLQDGRPVAIVNPETPVAPCGMLPAAKKQGYEWAAPTTASQTTTVETLCTQTFEPRQTVVQTVEEKVVPPESDTEVIFVQQEQITEPAPIPAPEFIEQPTEPQPTIWAAPAPAEPVCPCPDPNDPCPQCYDK